MSDKIQTIRELEEKHQKLLDETKRELEKKLLQEQQNLEELLREIRNKFLELEKFQLKKAEDTAIKEIAVIKEESEQKIKKLLETKERESKNIIRNIIKELTEGQ